MRCKVFCLIGPFSEYVRKYDGCILQILIIFTLSEKLMITHYLDYRVTMQRFIKNYVKHFKNNSKHDLLSVFILHRSTQTIYILNLSLMPIPKFYSRIVFNVKTSIFTMILFTHTLTHFTSHILKYLSTLIAI